MHMKKLVVVPFTIITGFVVFSFGMPSTAASVLNTFAPSLVAGASSSSAANARLQSGAAAQKDGTSQLSGSRASQVANPGVGFSSSTGHTVSTAAHSNCGRFGNGFHGGKHLFVCPNRPFPAPAS
jgi:hypothetical protein